MTTALLFSTILLPALWKRLYIGSPFGFIFFFCFTFFVLKVVHHSLTDSVFLEYREYHSISFANLALSLYLLGAYIVFLVLKSRTNDNPAADNKEAGDGLDTIVVISTRVRVLTILVPTFFFVLALKNNINPIENPLAFRQLMQSGGKFYFLAVHLFFNTFFAIYVFEKVFFYPHKIKFSDLVVYVYLMAFAVMSGFASMLVQFAFAPLIFLSALKRIKVEWLVFFSIPFVLLFTLFYSKYRDVRRGGGDTSFLDVFQMVFSGEPLSQQMFNRFDYLEMLSKGLEIQKTEFLHFLGVVVQPVPRLFWPEKPLNFSSYMTSELLPQNFAIGVTANFNSLNEFIINFSAFGFIVGSLFLGLLLYLADFFFLRSRNHRYFCYLYVLVVYPYATTGFVAGYLNDLALPLLCINLLLFFSLLHGKFVVNDARVSKRQR